MLTVTLIFIAAIICFSLWIKYLHKCELFLLKFEKECHRFEHLYSIFYLFEKNGIYGIITTFGKIIFDGYSKIDTITRTPYCSDYKISFLRFYKDGKTELRNRFFLKILSDFEEISAYHYRHSKYSSDVLFFYCKKDTLWGIYSTFGKMIIPCIYDDIEANIKTIYKDGLINSYEEIISFTFNVRSKNKWGMRTFKGKSFIPCEYDTNLVAHSSEKRFLYFTGKKERKVYAISKKGKILTPPCDDIIFKYGSGICFKENEMFHFIRNGKIVISSKSELSKVGKLVKRLKNDENIFSLDGKIL